MRSFTLLVLLAPLIVSSAPAQVATARLEGTIQDSAGAVVPGVKVEAVNVKTQARSATISRGGGHFIFPTLPPSEYTLTAEAAGFRKAVRSNLTLSVAATVTEVITLEVGAVTESVVVEANAVRVQVADAQISRVITLRDIELLPQLGRG